MSSRCGSSARGSSTTMRRVSAVAAARSPSASASAARPASADATRSRCSSRSSCTQSSSRPSSRGPRESASASSTFPAASSASKSARSVATTPARATVSRSATRQRSASGPNAFRSAESALRRLVRALSSSTSGQKRAASCERGCARRSTASTPRSARARRLAGSSTSLESTSSASSPKTRTRTMRGKPTPIHAAFAIISRSPPAVGVGSPTMKRALYVSSPIGLGHAQRDVAIARELRAQVPDLQVDWLAQDPVTRVLEAEGETIHPASVHLASESGHFESESAEHDLHCFHAWRRMDEILIANFMVFHDTVTEQDRYDLWIADEGWEIDYYLHENPNLKTAHYVWLTDFVGWLPNEDAD